MIEQRPKPVMLPDGIPHDEAVCPLMTRAYPIMASPVSGLQPVGGSPKLEVQFSVGEMKCLGARCALWWSLDPEHGMCSLRRIGYDLKAFGDMMDQAKFKGGV